MTGPRSWPATAAPASTSEEANGPGGTSRPGAVRAPFRVWRVFRHNTGSRLANLPRPPAHESGRVPPGGPSETPPALLNRSPTLTLERRSHHVGSADDTAGRSTSAALPENERTAPGARHRDRSGSAHTVRARQHSRALHDDCSGSGVGKPIGPARRRGWQQGWLPRHRAASCDASGPIDVDHGSSSEARHGRPDGFRRTGSEILTEAEEVSCPSAASKPSTSRAAPWRLLTEQPTVSWRSWRNGGLILRWRRFE
jgi:hypothetical protein